MPVLKSERLKKIISVLLQSAGATRLEASIVSSHSVKANLAGHDSHGIIQIPTYIDRIKQGHLVPKAQFEIKRESPSSTVVDGHWGFGYVVSEKTMELTIEKAKNNSVAAATVFRQGHVGRVADYPIMAAKAGMIGMMTADSGRSAKQVAPFGGREARLGTNPISVAIPSNLEGPLFVDMATSAVAAGKINLAIARKQMIPEGWLIDKDGQHTTDPTEFSQGGVILPLGGTEGHKGYGLSVIVEILSGLLTGLGFGVEPSGRHNDGCFMAVFNVEAFRPLEEFKQEVTELALYLKNTPTSQGNTEVYYPGELEHIRTKKLLKNGILVEDTTWAKINELASEFGVKDDLDM